MSVDLEGLRMLPRFAQAGFAVADLSGPTARFAGWNLDKPRFSGSVIKITALFAALQLREQLNLAAKVVKKENLFKTVTAEWYPRVARAVAGPANFPQLDKLFVFKPDGEVEFHFEVAKKIGLMTSYSDKTAAGECIRLLGHQYINGALAAEGLYSTKRSGLWIGGDYANVEYAAVPGGSTHYAATPAALLRFLELVHSGRLVSAAGTGKMKRVMENCWTFNVLQAKGARFLAPPESFGKLGWEYVNGVRLEFDAGVVHRVTDQGNFRYAIVVLGLPPDDRRELIGLLDNIVVDRHFAPPLTNPVRHTFA